jgi:hypothetical protein
VARTEGVREVNFITHENQQHVKFLFGYLKRIPNDGRYETWTKVGLAIHTLTGGSMVGAQLFYDWSKVSPRHTDEGFITFWRNYGQVHAAMELLSAMAQPPNPLDNFDHATATRH